MGLELYIAIWLLEFQKLSWETIANRAPIATATVAIFAFAAAVFSVLTQRSIARKRAAIDVFIKTEMDASMVAAFESYRKARDALKKIIRDSEFEQFVGSADYRAIRDYLNIHELIAVGYYNGAFDKKVCRDYWANILMNACRDVRRVIDQAKALDGGTYCELERLNKEWSSQLSR